jgi:hypothetical protein
MTNDPYRVEQDGIFAGKTRVAVGAVLPCREMYYHAVPAGSTQAFVDRIREVFWSITRLSRHWLRIRCITLPYRHSGALGLRNEWR